MSDTVKFIVEIPKIDKELLDAGCCGETRKEAILYAVKNGTPLDSIKAKIDDEWARTHHMYPEYADGLVCAYQIIDQYIYKTESEE